MKTRATASSAFDPGQESNDLWDTSSVEKLREIRIQILAICWTSQFQKVSYPFWALFSHSQRKCDSSQGHCMQCINRTRSDQHHWFALDWGSFWGVGRSVLRSMGKPQQIVDHVTGAFDSAISLLFRVMEIFKRKTEALETLYDAQTLTHSSLYDLFYCLPLHLTNSATGLL